MRLTNFILLLFTFLLNAVTLSAQSNYLRVGDPRQGWWTDQGTIEEATFVTRPQGIYTAVDMYLTFSSRGTYWVNPSDTLEVTLNFTLPTEAIVYDSWLWIDSIIIKADILDRWTASTIYENIVNRRKDPSILFKDGPGQYQLRIFPMAGNKSRRVKISYLIPAQWTINQVLTELPVELLPTSRTPVPQVLIRTAQNPTWGQPFFANLPERTFTAYNDQNGRWWQAVLNTTELGKRPLLTYNAPLQDGVFVNRLDEGQGGFYQMVFLPKEVFGLEAVTPKKLLVLMDYVSGNSTVSQAEMLNQIKQQLLASLTPRDSFNLMVSKLVIKPVSDRWLPATPQAIEAAFAALGSNPSSGYSNLPSLLGQGIDFVRTNNNSGNILLFANSSNVASISSANLLINDLRNEMNNAKIRIFINDFQQQNYNWYYAANQSFRGNEYFYSNIARLTGGEYLHLFDWNSAFAANSRQIFESATALSGSLDLHTRLQNGFCHSRYNIGENINIVNYNRPVFQIGKYEGAFPFVIEAVGSLDGNLISTQISVDAMQAAPADSLTREVWTGNYLHSLEELEQANATISKIIAESIQERVLSRYTAFIALEPAQGGKPCLECVDETDGPVVDTEDLLGDTLLKIQALPNPFKNRVTLVLQFSVAKNVSDYQFAIYNMMGQQVKLFNDVANTSTDRVELTWEAGDAVPAGMYFFVAQSPQERHSLKLVKF
ncbi:MAG: VIT domain-containing protein [Saprospiraceae bacterium]